MDYNIIIIKENGMMIYYSRDTGREAKEGEWERYEKMFLKGIGRGDKGWEREWFDLMTSIDRTMYMPYKKPEHISKLAVLLFLYIAISQILILHAWRAAPLYLLYSHIIWLA